MFQVFTDLAQKDIRQLDFPALYKAGYRGAVFDKDNCLVRLLLMHEYAQ